MQKLMDWLERSFAPKMNKLNRNVWIQALKDAMMQILPLILVGSLVTVLALLQDFIPSMPNLWTVSNYTMGLIGAIVSFLVPFNVMERKKLHKLRLVAGMTSFAMFAIIVRLDDAASFDFSSFGAGGMFAAIVVGLVSGIVFSIFGSFSFFKEDSAMPDFVRQWFDNMLPVSILIFATWLLVYVFNVDLFTLIAQVLSPLTNFAETLPGFVLFYFLRCFIYSMGISTWMLYPVFSPIFLSGIAANAALAAQGLAAVNVNTDQVLTSWLAVGGAGGTLVLVYMMVFLAKSKNLKAIGRASLVPSIFNINEPVVFGAVAWNPTLMVPMWIQGLIVPIIVWFGLKSGLAAIPAQIFGFWYCPAPFYTWLVSPGVGGLILLAIVVAVDIVIYFPFFKLYDKMQQKEELAAADKKAGV